jgi:hypothetical protein
MSPYSTQLRLSADQTAFIGVRFRSGTDAHYAWIRIFVNPMLSGNAPVTTTLMESAYNKNVNQQILAGKK